MNHSDTAALQVAISVLRSMSNSRTPEASLIECLRAYARPSVGDLPPNELACEVVRSVVGSYFSPSAASPPTRVFTDASRHSH